MVVPGDNVSHLLCIHLSSAVKMLCSLSENVSMWALLGPKLARQWRPPYCVIAAHIVMLPPCCPWTFKIALLPMMFFPLLLTFVRLNPASSTKINSCRIASASICKTKRHCVVQYRPTLNVHIKRFCVQCTILKCTLPTFTYIIELFHLFVMFFKTERPDGHY